jgi:hypothetical protein
MAEQVEVRAFICKHIQLAAISSNQENTHNHCIYYNKDENE